MGVTVKSTLVSKWTPETVRKLDVAVLSLATRVHRDAGRYAPVDTGNLVASGRVQRRGEASYSVIFGGGAIRYAARRHRENRLHPNTLRYLERAGDENSRRFVQELKRI